MQKQLILSRNWLAKKEPLTKSVIKQPHYLALKRMDDENAGQYRNYGSLAVRISLYTFCVQEQMNQL
jgi:hypothetical protein